MRAYAVKNVVLWAVPSKSPDLNPIEMFWGWVRRQLRVKDLDDMRQKRAPLGKAANTLRIKILFRSRKAQRVAQQCAKKLRSACQRVIKNKGAAAGN